MNGGRSGRLEWTERRKYDLLGRVVRHEFSQAGQLIQAEELAYDLSGRVRQRNFFGPDAYSVGYTYDDNGQLIREDMYGPSDRGALVYTYDGLGHRSLEPGSSSARNALDAAGRKLKVGDVNFTYDAFGLLVQANPSRSDLDRISYAYDAQGRLIQRWAPEGSATFLRLPDGRLLAELNLAVDDDGCPSLSVRHTLWLDDRPVGTVLESVGRPAQVSFSLHDGLGIWVGHVSPDAVPSLPRHSAFGVPLNEAAQTPPRMPFLGHERHEPTLDWVGARLYHPASGSFTTPDPHLAHRPTSRPAGLNAYAFALNDPLNYGDPTGLDPEAREHLTHDLSDFSYGGLDPGRVEPTWSPLDYLTFGHAAVQVGRMAGKAFMGMALHSLRASPRVMILWGHQGKHIIGHNNYRPGRSILTHKDPQSLLNKFSGKGTAIYPEKVVARGTPGFKEKIDFKQEIGLYAKPLEGDQVELIPTRVGIVHYAKKGAHIVPAQPQ